MFTCVLTTQHKLMISWIQKCPVTGFITYLYLQWEMSWRERKTSGYKDCFHFSAHATEVSLCLKTSSQSFCLKILHHWSIYTDGVDKHSFYYESIKNFQAKIVWSWNTAEKCNTIHGLEKIMAKCYVHRRSLWSTEVSGFQYLVQENPVKGITELQRYVSSDNSLR